MYITYATCKTYKLDACISKERRNEEGGKKGKYCLKLFVMRLQIIGSKRNTEGLNSTFSE